MKILTLEEISHKLQDRRLYTIAEKTGLSFPTLKRLAEGKTKNYTLNTLVTISNYFIEESQSDT